MGTKGSIFCLKKDVASFLLIVILNVATALLLLQRLA